MSSSFISKLWNFMKKIMKNIIFQAVSLAILLVGMGVTYAAWTTLTASQGASGQPVNQTLVQGIINNLNDLNTRLQAINPSGTTLSGSSVCIGATCKTTWPAGGGTGISGILTPLEGKSISCSFSLPSGYTGVAYAKVTGGILYVRATGPAGWGGPNDSGWIVGNGTTSSTSLLGPMGSYNVVASLDGVAGNSATANGICAYWPRT